jgi:uncharacterized membrane protein YhaH (DUF805 family)
MALSFILRGFRLLLHPWGRDTVEQFWPFALTVFLGTTALTMIPAMLIMMPVMAKLQSYALAHPDRAQVMTGSGGTQITFHGPLPHDMAIDMSGFMGLTMAQGAVMILLVASAVARRLHDAGYSGLLGLVPVLLMINSFRLMAPTFQHFGTAFPDTGQFLTMFGSNLAYLAAMGGLIFLLTRPSQPHDNRYGPPPER